MFRTAGASCSLILYFSASCESRCNPTRRRGRPGSRQPDSPVRTLLGGFLHPRNPFLHLAYVGTLVISMRRGDSQSISIGRRMHAQATRSTGRSACRPRLLRTKPVSTLDASATHWTFRLARRLRICLDGTPSTCPSNPIERLERSSTAPLPCKTRFRI
jgi:hypothetical protein